MRNGRRVFRKSTEYQKKPRPADRWTFFERDCLTCGPEAGDPAHIGTPADVAGKRTRQVKESALRNDRGGLLLMGLVATGCQRKERPRGAGMQGCGTNSGCHASAGARPASLCDHQVTTSATMVPQ